MTSSAAGWLAGEYDVRLMTEFGLAWADLRDQVLVRAHNLARPFASASYPPGSYGQMRYMEGVRLLTELLTPWGWTPGHSDQICRFISPSGEKAIVVQTGDAVTGVRKAECGRDPRTKYPKGDALRRVVTRNEPILPLWDEADDAREGDGSRMQTWFLLSCVDPFGLKSELSLPKSINTSGYIDDWSDRILFPSVDVDSSSTADFGSYDDGDDIDIPVDAK